MAKKITLTVTESLSRKIETWRSSFNLSRLFQDAVSEAIGRKEEFQKRLSGKADIPQIVERLKAEKRGLRDKAAAAGEAEGSAWAGRAHYEDLVAAVMAASSARPASEENRAVQDWEAHHSPAGMEEKEREAVREAYRGGWRSGVLGLWDRVKDQLQDT